jgi:hypothetical protein
MTWTRKNRQGSGGRRRPPAGSRGRAPGGVEGAKPPMKVTLFHEFYSDFALSK